MVRYFATTAQGRDYTVLDNIFIAKLGNLEHYYLNCHANAMPMERKLLESNQKLQ